MKLIILLLTFSFLSCFKKKTTEQHLAIQPYEGISKKYVDTLKKDIETFYGLQVTVLEEIQLPKRAFTTFKAPRYRADSLIRIQKEINNNDFDYYFDLTNKDICITKYNKEGSIKEPKNKYIDFGIMGLAYCPGNSCIVSTFRLKHSNKNIFFTRIQKVMLHEIGHNLGLPHCPDTSCFMTDAVESVHTIDNAKLELCNYCKNKINL